VNTFDPTPLPNGLYGRLYTRPAAQNWLTCPPRTIQMRPVWNGSEFKPRLILPLSLSWDHRVVDGAAAARFNAFLAGLLGDARRMLL